MKVLTTNPNYININSVELCWHDLRELAGCSLPHPWHDKYAPYGSSVLELSRRRIWRQLTLMEDAMMAYRIVRSSERRVFKIDVGAIPPNEVEQYMEKT